jgi:putative nucleotidyltransferase with HDIG domain
MTLTRLAYRLRQFRLAWAAAALDPSALERARQILGPRLWPLFVNMQPGEQTHSLTVLQKVTALGASDPDLLIAALLHDVGKSRSPLSVWDRSWIVLAKKLVPQAVKIWGKGSLDGRWRIFVVAEQHPAWGAEMAAAAGASPRCVDLIRQHQEQVDPANPLAETLHMLQGADDES